MKQLMIVLLSLWLTGCAYQITSAGDISEAQQICLAHGGVNHIAVSFDSVERVTCQDEFSQKLHKNE
jgi:hypothetical protein